MLAKENKSREDPFKEIAMLRHLRGTPGFPVIETVLENATHLVNVEYHAGISLLQLVMKDFSRIPEELVICIGLKPCRKCAVFSFPLALFVRVRARSF